MSLQRTSRGDSVRAWQEQLVRAGYPVDVDGIFGPETDAATKQYQAVLGVTPDGVVGPETRAAAQGDPTTRKPRMGDAVQGLNGQDILIIAGGIAIGILVLKLLMNKK